MFKRSLPRPTFMLVLVTTSYQELILFLASGICLRMEFLHHEIHWDLARGKKLRSNLELQSVNRDCIHHLVLHLTSIDNDISPSRRLRHGYGKPISGQHEWNDRIHKDDMLLV
ncbi:hypothetical protein HZH66_004389 [Vespula vulgaris]|uniref:Uncharacterized protein n=1 Tax=Vespula vulgaris TaxID=7454 RepID=A0A834NFG2_VESVU|nr:hypothetical protein HZH66_004389 [Vespula vulgaris]